MSLNENIIRTIYDDSLLRINFTDYNQDFILRMIIMERMEINFAKDKRLTLTVLMCFTSVPLITSYAVADYSFFKYTLGFPLKNY